MTKHHFRFIFAIIMTLSGALFGQQHLLAGYFQSWNWQEHPQQLDPQNIPYDKLDIIYYSFFYPGEDGTIAGMDPVADNYLLKGIKANGLTAPATALTERAKPHGTRVILSIGGWDHSDNFPQVSADPKKRVVFAAECIRLVNEYGFAGIDIDWEFPGYVRHKGTPQDRENFTVLLRMVRDSLNSLEQRSGQHYLLTASLPAAASHLADLEVDKISAVVDYINIMTWDLFGSWGELSNHNSALFSPARGDPGRCLDGAFKLYHVDHKVPAEKINLGAAFYGHSYTGCTEIYTKHQGADSKLFPKKDALHYRDIAEKMNLFERMWDVQAQAPYLVSRSLKMLISLDDEQSVALKSDYVIKNKAAGLLVWPLMGDYLKDSHRTPLLDTIYTEFSGK